MNKKWVKSHPKEYNAYLSAYRRFRTQKAKWIENALKEGNLVKAQQLACLKPNLHVVPEISSFIRKLPSK